MKSTDAVSRMPSIPSPSVCALATGLAWLALTSPQAQAQTQTETPSATAMPATACVSELTAFDAQLQKDGYWLHGAGYGYGYGYPMAGYGYGYAYGGAGLPPAKTMQATGYWSARPGYEVRSLLASADILAQRGDQAGCESLITAARAIYTRYAADLRNGKVPRADTSAWRRQQIAIAVAVTVADTSFRSDEMVGAEVVNPRGEDLGSVEDIVMDPQSGKIGYLVIERGGIFGINRKYVPVPWDDFKAAPGNKLFVLASVKATMDAAPQVKEDQKFSNQAFATEAAEVNAYWAAHLAR
jgi:sporulation protein YlmC with PRC-barrel domain